MMYLEFCLFFFFNFAELVVEIELTLDFEVIRGFWSSKLFISITRLRLKDSNAVHLRQYISLPY